MTSIIPLVNQIEIDRINNRIEVLAQIGKTESAGVTRLAFSREDFEARNLLMGWMREEGLEVERDAVGNIFGTIRGTDSSAPIIACGSHIDTVINAGRYDGIVGTLAAVECAHVINAHPHLGIPLQVVCFAMEESARFGGGYGFGSRVLTGEPIPDVELMIQDTEGITLARAIQSLKRWESGETRELDKDAAPIQTQDEIQKSRRDFSHWRAFLELHIEQGPVLEHAGKQIGIVTAIAAPTRLRVTFHGVKNHSGTTPMNLRHDALAAAAEVILAIERIAKERADQGTVATVGVLRIDSGSINAIPGHTEILVDIRGIDASVKRTTVEAVMKEFRDICQRRGVRAETQVLTDEQPVPLSSQIIETIASVCSDLGTNAIRLHSGAGHDAAHLARVTETGMIFIPSKGGVSHSPAEFTSPQHIALGARVLLGTILSLSGKFDSADGFVTRPNPLAST